MKQIQLMHAYAYIGNICLTFNECFVHAVHLGDIYAMFAECAGTFSVSWVVIYRLCGYCPSYILRGCYKCKMVQIV